MSYFAENDIIKNEIIEIINYINNINLDNLMKTTELGTQFSFRDGMPYFERTLSLVQSISDNSLEYLPHKYLDRIKYNLLSVQQCFQRLSNFNPAQANAVAERNNIIDDFKSKCNSLYEELNPIFCFAIKSELNFKGINKNAKDLIKKLNNTQTQANQVLENIRQIAAQSVVSHHATKFDDEYQNHNTLSHRWLLATIGLSIFIFLYMNYLFELAPTNDEQTQTFFIIKYFTSRFAIFSVLMFMLIWSGKNYAAHKHNAIINKHRQNALITFETFVKAAENDQDTKNAVLLQATQSIFSPLPTGYINKESEKDQSNKVIEIMRSVGASINK